MGLLIKDVNISREEVVGFVCDRCGIDHTEDRGGDSIFEIQERFEFNHTGGYASVWGDETTVKVVLCQGCAFDLLSPYVNKGEDDAS